MGLHPAFSDVATQITEPFQVLGPMAHVLQRYVGTVEKGLFFG